jgi:hypothetical protein
VCRVFSCDRHGSSWAEKWTSVSPWSEDSRALALDLLARSNHIAATKLQRSRVQHGDFVSDEVLASRAARANLERTIVGGRRQIRSPRPAGMPSTQTNEGTSACDDVAGNMCHALLVGLRSAMEASLGRENYDEVGRYNEAH